jgi:hypothetical protein
MIRHARVSVGVAPTLLTAPESDMQAGSRLLLRNTSATASVFLGAADVTAVDGYELPAGTSLSLTLDSRDSLHAVTAVGDVPIHVLRVGV